MNSAVHVGGITVAEDALMTTALLGVEVEFLFEFGRIVGGVAHHSSTSTDSSISPSATMSSAMADNDLSWWAPR